MRNLLLILLWMSVFTAPAQPVLHLRVKNSTLAAAGDRLPFWFMANQQGKIQASGSLLNVTELYAGQERGAPGIAFSWAWGVNAVAGLGEDDYRQLNQAFAGLRYKGWAFTGGLFQDADFYQSLSATNGNLARSLNARPYPKLRLATIGYKRIPLLSVRLNFRAEYDEGFLNDNRYVDGTRLHHKSFYLQLPLRAGWSVETGIEHFVMWAGTSPVEKIGKMPSGFKSYLLYITGRSGNDEFPQTDRLNVAGNQLGTYQFRVTKHFNGTKATFYLSHPFEDLSGMNWRNWPDNLLGLHLSFAGEQKTVTSLLYEYTNTRQQSIRGAWDRQEPDNYYNHGIYRSGFTFHGQMMGSPLFFPVNMVDGTSRGLLSNRFYAHHLGAGGYLSENIRWKSMLTRIHHFGRYFQRQEPSAKQLSVLLELVYFNPAHQIELGLSAAADEGNTTGSNPGLQFWIGRRW